MEMQKKKKCSQRRSQKSLTRWLYQRSAGSQNDLLRRSKTGDLQRTPPVSPAPPLLCPRNRFPNPILHNLSFLRPFSSLPISQTRLWAGPKKPVPRAKAETAWGAGAEGWGMHASFRPASRREAELCAEARRLQGPATPASAA